MKSAIVIASALLLASCVVEPVGSLESELQASGNNNGTTQPTPYAHAGRYVFDDMVTFEWWDLAAVDGELPLADDGAGPVAVPFDLVFYGDVYNSVSVAANGVVAFEEATKFSPTNLSIASPNADATRFLAVLWDDIDFLASSRIVHKVIGEEPNRKLVIAWLDVVHFDDPTAAGSNFGVSFEEGTNLITAQYQNLAYMPDDDGATIGAQESATEGTEYLFGTTLPPDDLAVLFFIEGCGADDECIATCDYDPDCPICIMDGDCNADCDSDPDCTAEECGMDGTCNMACEDDPDCVAELTCIADDVCDETCETDPDCENCEENDVCNPACDSDPDCNGGCAAGSTTGNRSAPLGLLMLGFFVFGVSRRRRG